MSLRVGGEERVQAVYLKYEKLNILQKRRTKAGRSLAVEDKKLLNDKEFHAE